jgi:putative ABC transport system permease protein
MQTLWQDLRYGVRMLRKQPGFTLMAVLTLALGIGANTAIFSVVNALLLRPLPYVEPERLVLLSEKWRTGKRHSASHPNYADWQARAQSFEGMAIGWQRSFTLTAADKAVRTPGLTANWNFLDLLGVRPQLGRLFNEADDRYGAARTVIVSHGFWQGTLGGAANVIGQTLRLTDEPYTIVGVLPPGFEYFDARNVFTPLGLMLAPDSPFTGRGNHAGDFYAVARLKSGVTVAQANREMDALGQQLAREHPTINGGSSAQAERLQDVMSESVRYSLWLLFGAVGFILLIACINVANLLLVRAAERQKELAVRMALGAGTGRIIRQLFSESLLLALLGAASGLLLGRWMLDGLLALAPTDIPRLNRVALDKTVLLFTLGLAVLTSLLFGLLPAWQAARTNLQSTLKDGGRLTMNAAREGLRKGLLIAEVSLSLVLLTGAGLLVRSMWNLLHVDLGFQMDNALTMRVNLQGGRYDDAKLRIFYDELLQRVTALPGVRSAALAHSVPINGSNWDGVFLAADKPVPVRADQPESERLRVTPAYFETLGIRLLRGRLFTAADTAEAAPVVVINQTMAQRLWPNDNPLGKRIKFGFPESRDATWREIVGVVNDVKMNGPTSIAALQTYLPYAQMPGDGVSLIVRAERNAAALAATVERTVHAIDKDLPVFGIRTMDQLLGNALAQRRLTLVLLASLAALALLLAAVGIHGVVSYSVRQRTLELGLRMAFGAQARDVLALILKQGLKLTLIGIGLGLLSAFALTRWMESLLFGVPATDALTFGVIAVTLLLVALLACWIPARQATKVDPMIALRCE